jgi:hypothetical protein
MTDANLNLEVISAFVDNEPFDPDALSHALAEPGGRDLLIDFIALRHVVSAEGADMQRAPAHTPSRWRGVLAAAAFVAALAGGYAVGRDSAASGPVADSASTAPQPTRTIELRPGVEWQPASQGR